MALFALCLVGCENGSGQKKSDYVDLGLPSGTKWKKTNEKNLMPYADAMGLYKGMMPTIEQWQELRDECVWIWSNNGYQVTGTNGKSIWLPAEGNLVPGEEGQVEVCGSFWRARLEGQASAPRGARIVVVSSAPGDAMLLLVRPK